MTRYHHRPPSASRFRAAALCWALVAGAIVPMGVDRAEAQTIGGRLLDLVSEGPIPAGVLTLFTPDSVAIATAVSDREGRWVLRAPAAGTYHIVAEAFGYRRWRSVAVELGVTPVTALFHLEPAPVELDPIEARVRAVRQQLEYAGFFERQRGNFGHFLGPETIDRRQATRVSDLLTSLPGVRRMPAANGSVGPTQIHLRGSSLSQGGYCRPRIFVDGLMYARGDARPVTDREGRAVDDFLETELRHEQALDLDDIGHPSTIAGIEVYRSASQVPVRFGGTSVETLCGVIVVWTRTGRTRAGG